MKLITIYTNGQSLFTLEDYDKTSAVSVENGITMHKQVSVMMERAMHSNGTLHYIFGTGDRKELKGLSLSRNITLKNFNIA